MISVVGTIIFNLLGTVTLLIVSYITYIYFWAHTYWQRKGVPYIEPEFFFGNVREVVLRKIPVGEQCKRIYNELKSRGVKYGGEYSFYKPIFMPVDPELVKHIMQKDFQHFTDRGITINEKVDPLNGNLFMLSGNKWRTLRTKLTPTFTSGKMKMMFQTFVDCTAGLKDILDNLVAEDQPADIKDIMGRFTTDIIGSCAFGIDCNSLKDPDTEFRIYGKKFFTLSTGLKRVKDLLLQMLPPSLIKKAGLKMFHKDIENFFMDIVRKTVDYREQNNIYRKDFMHLLLQLKNRGQVFDDEKIKEDHNHDDKKNEVTMNLNELSAQAFIFFIAGFETSSTTMTWGFYELAVNSHIQEKLREEIHNTLAKYNGEITYDGVMEMTYLDKVVNETLRKYPPLPLLQRVCTEDYVIPETSMTLEKGTRIQISTLGLQTDPEYYPEPEKFDPERFTEENKSKRHPFTFIPFGEGPRICIGLRFGLLQSKVGIITILRDYKITLSKLTKTPVRMSKEFITTAEGGIWLDIHKLNTNK